MIDKSNYNKIDIPENLSSVVDEAIKYGLSTTIKPYSRLKKVASLAAVFCIIFVTLLNTSQIFAAAIYEIPIVGNVCRIFTFREYHIEDPIKYVDVKVPHIDNSGKTELEARVNLEISKLISENVEKGEERAKEYYKAFIETGGKSEDFTPIGINIDYEIKSISEKSVSFVITKYETFASAYFEQYFYNMDLQTGKLFTLKDWFGSDYKDIVASSIEETISHWSDYQKEALFQDVDIDDLITENRNFYLNDQNQIVVVFEKYEVAVGAAGILEFPITTTSE